MRILLVILFLTINAIGMAQDITIPYRKGKVWGLCDTNANIIIEPQFSRVYFFKARTSIPQGGYFVYKNKKAGMILNNKLVVPTQYQAMAHDRQFIKAHRNVSGNNNVDILNNKGEVVLERVQRLYRFKTRAYNGHYNRYNKNYFVYTKNKKGKLYCTLFQADKNGNVKNTILKNKRSISFVNSQNNIIVYDDKGNRILYDCDFQKSGLKLKVVTKKKVTLDQYDRTLVEDVMIDEAPAMPRMDRENPNNYYTYYSLEGNNLYEHTGTKNEESTKEKTLVRTNCKNCKLADYNASKKYEWLDKVGSKTYYAKNYVLTYKKKQYGILSKTFSMVPQFSSVKTVMNHNSLKPGYVVSTTETKTKVKQIGILKSNGKWLLPLTTKYDKVYSNMQDKNYFIMKDKKLGLLSKKGVELISPEYQKIKRIGYLKYGIKQNDQWGLFQGDRIIVTPRFDDVPTGIKYFYKRYKTYQMVDELTNKVLGYTSENGLKYYEE